MLLRHGAESDRRVFGWRETGAVLRELEGSHRGARLLPAAHGFALVVEGGERERITVPAVQRRLLGDTATPPRDSRAGCDAPVSAAGSLAAFLRRIDDPLGRELVLLLRAGAAALGLWCDGELRAHKVFTRYVVRGHGHAQPSYRKTKGKSRYGARLRLQEARALLTEVNERCAAWWDDCGGFDAVFVGCPTRLWADLCAAEPAPPFLGKVEPQWLRLHVHEPRHTELLRVRWQLEHGTVESS